MRECLKEKTGGKVGGKGKRTEVIRKREIVEVDYRKKERKMT